MTPIVYRRSAGDHEAVNSMLGFRGMNMSYSLLFYLGFTIAAAVEMYFFLMQRVPLSLSREHGIDNQVCRFMLPSWYGFVWISKIAKWIFIVLIWQNFGWVPAVLPIPFTHFANIMEKRLALESVGPNAEIAATLMEALKVSRSKHGFWALNVENRQRMAANLKNNSHRNNWKCRPTNHSSGWFTATVDLSRWLMTKGINNGTVA